MSAKIINLTFICIVLIWQATNYTQSRWEWISPYPHGNGATATTVADNYIYFFGSRKTVVKTSDSGESFVVCTPYKDMDDVGGGPDDRQKIAFADSLIGFIADANKHYRTTDGGISWNEVGGGGWFITFANSQIGWKGPTLSKTTDAGLTWQNKYNPILEDKGTYAKIFALDTDRVWILKSFHYDGGGGIYFSSDGGENWQEQDIGVASDSSNRLYFSDIIITETGYGMATARIFSTQSQSYTTLIFRTTNFGDDWEYNTYLNYRLLNCFLKSDSEWLIFGNSDEVQSEAVRFYTTDFGENWEITSEIYFGSRKGRFSIGAYLQSTNTLIIVSSYGFYRSFDFGQTFHRLTNTTDLLVKDFSIDNNFTPNQQLVVGISNDNHYILSEDGGYSWIRDTIVSINEPQEVSVSNGIIFMISGYRFLHKSENLGSSWETLLNSYSTIRNLQVLNQDHLAVIQKYSTPPKILYTADGGNSWTEGPFPMGFYFNSFQILDERLIYGCGRFSDSTGNKGFVYKSTNKGLDWRIIDFDMELLNIQMVNNRIGYVHGGYKIYKTTDSGEHWYKIYEKSPFSYYFNSIFFYDSLNGIIRDTYKILETNDGGNTWDRNYMNLPVWGSVKKIQINKNGNLFALSDGSRFLRYTSKRDYIQNPPIDTNNKIDVSNFNLRQNYPNPFNPSTSIQYAVSSGQFVSLKVYDVLGKEIAMLVNEEKPAGRYVAKFDATGLPSGIYFYTLRAGSFVETKKMVLMK